MGSSPEMESFGISDADYAHMMDPLQQRRKQTKKQTIYGVFASDDSDSETELSGFGRRDAGSKRKGANYSTPITFVSGGLKLGAESGSDQKETDAQEADPISDEEDDKRVLSSLRPCHDSDSDSPESSAVQRVGKVSVGFYGSEKTAAPRRGNETVVEESGSSGPRYKKKPGTQRNQLVKPVYEYKTAEELVADLCPATPAAAVKRHGIFLENSALSKVKVIDMTSKEQKVYSGYEAALSRVVQKRKRPGDSSTLSDEEGPDADGNRIEKRIEGTFFDCPALRH
ncbi:unnamed protein product, partial [Heterobilharzia americana]